MPIKGEKYHLVPFNKGWRVMADNGTFYSNKALTLSKAKAQQRALYAKQRRGEIFHGSGYSFITHGGRTDMILKGSGWIGDIGAKIKSAAGAVAQRAKAVFKGIRKDFNPSSRAIIAKYGDWRIIGIKIRREPLPTFIEKAANFITKGLWGEVKNEYNYDKLYHLSLLITLTNGQQTNDVLFEKNQVINIIDSYNTNTSQDIMVVDWTSPGMTFNTFIENTKLFMGANFFPYDAFKNNCQNFVLDALRANGVNDEKITEFVLQPVDMLLKKLPNYIGPTAKVLTNLGGLADVAMYGEGKDVVMKRKDYFEEHKRIVGLLDSIADKLKNEATAQSQEAKTTRKRLEAKNTKVYGGVRLNGIILEGSGVSASTAGLLYDLSALLSIVAPYLSSGESARIYEMYKTYQLMTGQPTTSDAAKEYLIARYKPALERLVDKYAREIEDSAVLGSDFLRIDRGDVVETGDGKKKLKGGCMCGCGAIRSKLKKYLAARDIDPKKYLDTAKAAAKRTGYDPRALEFSDDDEHKLMIYDDKGAVKRFGRVGYGDFIIHSMSGAQSVADSKRERFRKSHMKIKGDWKNDKFSPNWLAINILW